MNSRNLILFGVSVLLLAGSARGALPQHDQYEHLGVQSCGASSCHGSVSERNVYSVMQNEYIIWARHDMHSRAYKVLKNDRSKRIAENLGLDAAHTAKICLDCHSDYVPRERRGLQFQLSDGVACEACHGGAEEWLGIHITGGSDKHAQSLAAGLYPTEDPEARAELCLSCHLGTRDKFATHRIMGAGHPRLSFDLQKFTEIQPQHYRVDADYKERKRFVEDTRAWAMGQVSAAKQYMSLLQGPRMNSSGMFPELGLFDCHSCHHSLKEQRWQPDDRSATPPGSVALNDSSLAMSQIIAGVVSPGIANTLLSGIRDLHDASQADAASIQKAAASLEGVLGQLADTLRQQSFGRQTNQQIMSALATAVQGSGFSDYSDAEQATMGLDIFSHVTGQDNAKVDNLYAAMEDEDQFSPVQFASAWSGTMLATAPKPAPMPKPAVRAPTSKPQTAPRPAPVATSPLVEAAPAQPTHTARATPSSRPAPAAAMIAGGSQAIVGIDGLRVRSRADATAAIRTNLYQGNLVTVVETTGEWSHIRYTRSGAVREGWVARRFLNPVAALSAGSGTQRIVNADSLRVRSRPEANAPVRTSLYQDSVVIQIDTSGQWSHIEYIDTRNGEKRAGWVVSEFLQ